MKYETKKSHSKRRNCLPKITYYKLRVGEQFAHYIISQSIESYRVGSIKEILDQALMIPSVFSGWKTMGKKPELMARMGLHSSQHHGSTMTNTMKSDLFDMVWDVVQANNQHGTLGIDESCRVLRS